MKIVFRDKTLPHQIDIGLLPNGKLQGRCNCGVIFTTGEYIYASEVKRGYDRHAEDVINGILRKRNNRSIR